MKYFHTNIYVLFIIKRSQLESFDKKLNYAVIHTFEEIEDKIKSMTNIPMKLTAPAKGIVQRALHGSWFTTAVYACYVAAVFCYCITYPHYFAVHTLIFGKKNFHQMKL